MVRRKIGRSEVGALLLTFLLFLHYGLSAVQSLEISIAGMGRRESRWSKATLRCSRSGRSSLRLFRRVCLLSAFIQIFESDYWATGLGHSLLTFLHGTLKGRFQHTSREESVILLLWDLNLFVLFTVSPIKLSLKAVHYG